MYLFDKCRELLKCSMPIECMQNRLIIRMYQAWAQFSFAKIWIIGKFTQSIVYARSLVV